MQGLKTHIDQMRKKSSSEKKIEFKWIHEK